MEMQSLEKIEHKSHQKLHSTDSRRNLNMQPLENLNAESGTQQELESAGSLTPNEGSMENQASGNGKFRWSSGKSSSSESERREFDPRPRQ